MSHNLAGALHCTIPRPYIVQSPGHTLYDPQAIHCTIPRPYIVRSPGHTLYDPQAIHCTIPRPYIIQSPGHTLYNPQAIHCTIPRPYIVGLLQPCARSQPRTLIARILIQTSMSARREGWGNSWLPSGRSFLPSSQPWYHRLVVPVEL